MAKISVKCPKCGQAMAFEYQPGIEEKNLVCLNPNCKHTDKVKNFTPNANLLGLHYPNGNKPHVLKVGTQVIGRYSEKVKSGHQVADIQISTPDHAMSRNQGALIVELPFGGTPTYLYEEYDVPNHTKINGVPLETGDIVYLKAKDHIQMGDTILILSAGD